MRGIRYVWRSFIYPGEIPRTYDHLAQWKDNLIALSLAISAMTGTNTPLLSGFGTSAQVSPNLTINVAPGQIFQLNALDPTPYGSCGSDSTQVYQQGVMAAAQVITFVTSQLSAGQNQYALVQVSFTQYDTVRPNDPTGGLLAYFNSNAPNQPLQGQSGNAAIQPTVREALATLSVVYGSPAAAGSAIPPAASSNALPLCLVLLTFGEIAITSGQIQPASPAVYSGYPYAPILPGMTQSHHNGTGGQAPQIILTNGKEVTGTMAFANLPVTNQTPPLTGSGVVQGSKIPILFATSENPNGNFAGDLGDFCLFGTQLYQCSTAGIASGTGQAVWTAVGGTGGPSTQYFNTSPFTPTNTYCTYLGDASVAPLTFDVPAVSSVGINAEIGVVMVGQNSAETNSITITPSGSDKFIINGQVVSGSIQLLQIGDSRTLIPCTISSGAMAGTYWLVA
jgi:hypothetical protein